MGLVVNCDPNPEGVDVSIDGVLHHVPAGEPIEVPDEKLSGMLAAPDSWAAPSPDAPPPPVAPSGDTNPTAPAEGESA